MREPTLNAGSKASKRAGKARQRSPIPTRQGGSATPNTMDGLTAGHKRTASFGQGSKPPSATSGPKGDHNVVIEAEAKSLDRPKPAGYTPTIGNKAEKKGKLTMANDADTNTEQTGRSRNLRFTYRNLSGEVQKEFDDNVVSVIAEVVQAGKSLEFGLKDLWPEQEDWSTVPAMLRMCGVTGLKTTWSNVLAPAAKQGWDGEAQYQALSDRKATIVEDKEWREGREGGPRITHLVNAVAAIRAREIGRPVSAQGLATLREKLLDKTVREQFMARPDVKTELAAQEMQRAAEKLAKTKAEAERAGGASTGLDNIE